MDWWSLFFSVELARTAVRSATPLVGAAVGEVIAERSGTVNIGLEGMMLMGAFTGVVGSNWFHNAWAGLLLAGIAGASSGLLLALLIFGFGVDQIVAGTAMNLMASGLTSFLNRSIFGQTPPPVPTFDSAPVPLLHSLPGVGKIFFEHIPIVYLAYLLAPLTGICLFSTPWGLRLRAVGEQERAAQSAGVPTLRYRILGLFFCGVSASAAGTYYSLGNVRFFTENMTVGNGFIALAIVIVARWNPFFVVPVALAFGLASSLSLRGQALQFPIPYELLLVLPYVFTLVVYAFAAHRKNQLSRK